MKKNRLFLLILSGLCVFPALIQAQKTNFFYSGRWTRVYFAEIHTDYWGYPRQKPGIYTVQLGPQFSPGAELLSVGFGFAKTGRGLGISASLAAGTGGPTESFFLKDTVNLVSRNVGPSGALLPIYLMYVPRFFLKDRTEVDKWVSAPYLYAGVAFAPRGKYVDAGVATNLAIRYGSLGDFFWALPVSAEVKLGITYIWDGRETDLPGTYIYGRIGIGVGGLFAPEKRI